MQDLTKVFGAGEVVANDRLSLQVDTGAVFGLLGPNGAGKTTLVKQLVGLLKPTSGLIEVMGRQITGSSADRRWVSERVAYLGQGALPFGELAPKEAVEWTARLRGLSAPVAEGQARSLAKALHLDQFWERPLRKLSGGQRRLTQIAMALTGDLPVLILDEPTTDVDPRLRQEIWEIVSRRARDGSAVVLVTHDIAEAEQVLDRVAILERGRVVAYGTPRDLKAELVHRTRLEIVLHEDAAAEVDAVRALFSEGAHAEGTRVTGWVPAEDAIRTLEKITATVGLEKFDDVRLITPTLEDVYLNVAARSLAPATAAEGAAK